ncbi:MAG TPA: class I SAM-dependent RNA methyltransferase [Limnochordia bacterium]|nr:class I SAM-dependent RNA methyltransferase [Limnochordia bacterium]
MHQLNLMATSTFGLEAVVAEELHKLGYTETKVENGKVEFPGDELAICRTNLWLRTAARVKIKVGEFRAATFEELFEQTKALPWADFLPKNAQFPVEGRSVKSTLYSVPDCQAIVKKAVVESLKQKYRLEWFPEDGPLMKIEVALLKDVATLSLDTSGTALHQRGYRELAGEAPLQETLAAALVLLARWHPDTPFLDPFCGSGTIPIEAALWGHNIAPGLNRSFAAENWPWIPSRLWRRVREEARDAIRPEPPVYLLGTDIDDRALKIARRNAELAGVSASIHFQRLDVRAVGTSKQYGKLITNPPYGERLGEDKEVRALYKELARLRKELDTWSFYILTAYPHLEKLFGSRATKRRKLYNGGIECQYYQYYGPRPPKKQS